MLGCADDLFVRGACQHGAWNMLDLGRICQHVRYRQPLTQQELAAGEVEVPGQRVWPPRKVAAELRAPQAEAHAGFDVVAPGVVRKPVHHKVVDAVAERIVAVRLEEGGIVAPGTAVGRSEEHTSELQSLR